MGLSEEENMEMLDEGVGSVLSQDDCDDALPFLEEPYYKNLKP